MKSLHSSGQNRLIAKQSPAMQWSGESLFYVPKSESLRTYKKGNIEIFFADIDFEFELNE